MTVAKDIEISTSSHEGFDDAIRKGLTKVSTTVSNMRGARIHEMKVLTTPSGAITEYRVRMQVSFVVE
jgi:dodecin